MGAMLSAQLRKPIQSLHQPLVGRPATKVNQTGAQVGAGFIGELVDIYPVLNHLQLARGEYGAKQLAIVGAGGHYPAIGARRETGEGVEVDALGARGKGGVKKTAVGGEQQWALVQPAGGGQVVVKKIHPVYMD